MYVNAASNWAIGTISRIGLQVKIREHPYKVGGFWAKKYYNTMKVRKYKKTKIKGKKGKTLS